MELKQVEHRLDIVFIERYRLFQRCAGFAGVVQCLESG